MASGAPQNQDNGGDENHENYDSIDPTEAKDESITKGGPQNTKNWPVGSPEIRTVGELKTMKK